MQDLNTKHPFAPYFRRALAAADMTSSAFAERTGITRSFISGVALGVRTPSPRLCEAAADILGLDRDEVFKAAGVLAPEVAVICLNRPDICRLVRAVQGLTDVELRNLAAKIRRVTERRGGATERTK